MLRSIFRIFDGIGSGREAAFRKQGCRDWQDLFPPGQLSLIPSPLEEQVAEAERRYAAGDVRWFYERLPKRFGYLLCAEFPEKVTYLDIETTGLSRVYHHLTLVGWARSGRFQYELLGRGKVPGPGLLAALDESPLVVTFNGNLFDIPFLRTVVDLPPLCPVDLRFLSFRLGYAGSMKTVEEALGVQRPGGYRNVRGEDAPALWFRAVRGEQRALRRLLDYNYLDVRGLAQIQRKLHPRATRADGLTMPRGAAAITGGRARFEVPARPSFPPAEIARDLAAIAPDAAPLLVAAPSAAARPVIVGIDLTGHARRGSGVCALRGDSAEALTLHEDEAILAYVERIRPDVVSIDAPLSLPQGRTRVDDGDPARRTAGIMRWSERELKRRGVNVYPCLLPSMQQLTARGIRLAERIRDSGIPCIESYPGAAQDILAMPRKGVGVQFLRRATEDAGWRLPDGPLSHDELDAVTSAIVGVFFLDDRYEALGTAAEDPMIVPILERPERRKAVVVAFSGAIGAGKTTASSWLSDRGFAYGRYSQVVAAEAHRRGLSEDRASLQRLGHELHDSWGQRELGRRLIDQHDAAPMLVVDGLRWRADVAFLREAFGPRLRHVHVAAPVGLRRARALRDGVRAEEFDAADAHPVEREVEALADLADVVLTNDRTTADLFREIDRSGVQRPAQLVPLLVPAVRDGGRLAAEQPTATGQARGQLSGPSDRRPF